MSVSASALLSKGVSSLVTAIRKPKLWEASTAAIFSGEEGKKIFVVRAFQNPQHELKKLNSEKRTLTCVSVFVEDIPQETIGYDLPSVVITPPSLRDLYASTFSVSDRDQYSVGGTDITNRVAQDLTPAKAEASLKQLTTDIIARGGDVTVHPGFFLSSTKINEVVLRQYYASWIAGLFVSMPRTDISTFVTKCSEKGYLGGLSSAGIVDTARKINSLLMCHYLSIELSRLLNASDQLTPIVRYDGKNFCEQWHPDRTSLVSLFKALEFLVLHPEFQKILSNHADDYRPHAERVMEHLKLYAGEVSKAQRVAQLFTSPLTFFERMSRSSKKDKSTENLLAF